MDLSIVIVNWNEKDFLVQCLESLLNQNVKGKFEIIVVDNASTDGSQYIVQERFPSVKLICNDSNLGFAKANNMGIKQSSGNYICLINSDIVTIRDCLKDMMDYMNRHPAVGMLGPRILNPDMTLQPSCMGFPTLWNIFFRALALDSLFPKSALCGGRLMEYYAHDTIRSAEVLNGCFLMVRRKALAEIGLLDESFFIYGEDVDWCKRFRDSTWEVVFYPNAEAIHYGGASSSKAPIKFYIEMQRADLQYWIKHHGAAKSIVYTLTSLLHQLLRVIGYTVKYICVPSMRDKSLFKIKRSLACLIWLMKIQNL